MNRTSKGLLAITCCATLWSMAGLFIKMVNWHPLVIAGSRSLIAALFMLTVRAVKSRSERGPAFAVITEASRKNPLPLLGAAIMNAGTMLLFVTANKLTTSANAILLQYAAPVYTAIFGWILLREKPGKEHFFAFAALVVGFYVFFKDGFALGAVLGDSLALLSGITFGLYFVFMRMQKDGEPQDSIILSHLISAAVGLPFAFINPPQISVPAITGILLLGVFQIGVASLFFAYAIRRISAVQAMVSSVIEPILNPVWVFIATGEQPAASSLAGGAIIIAAVSVSSIVNSLKNRKNVIDNNETP